VSGAARHIQPSDFRVGQPAPGDVVTIHGTRLLAAGTIVTAQHLDTLRALEPGTARIRPSAAINSSEANGFITPHARPAPSDELDHDVPAFRAATVRRRGRELEAELHAYGDRILKRPIPVGQPDVRFDPNDAHNAAEGSLDELRTTRLDSIRGWLRHVIIGNAIHSHTAGTALDIADELAHHARRHTASLATLVLPRVTDDADASSADTLAATHRSANGRPPIPWLHRLSVQAWATAGLSAGIAAAQGMPQAWVRIAALAGLFADSGLGVLPGFGVKTPDGSNWATARGPLTEIETNRMREHPSASLGLAEPILLAARIADDECWAALLAIAQHHERPDGTGFPRGERVTASTADRIHTISSAVGVADAFAGAWATRQYRPPNEPRTLAQTFVEYADRGALDRAGVRALAEIVGRVPVGSRLRRSDGVVVRVVAPMGSGKMAVQAMAA